MILPAVFPSGHQGDRPRTTCLSGTSDQSPSPGAHRRCGRGANSLGRKTKREALLLPENDSREQIEGKPGVDESGDRPGFEWHGPLWNCFPIPALTYFITNCFFKPHQ